MRGVGRILEPADTDENGKNEVMLTLNSACDFRATAIPYYFRVGKSRWPDSFGDHNAL
jgi:hypothetical protein